MKTNWLWDKKLTDSEARRILKDPSRREYPVLAALLLARRNDPREIFKNYINPIEFCRYWPQIKRRMRADNWNEPRIVFWQAIYEKLADKYRKRGVIFRAEKAVIRDLLREEVGKRISEIRRGNGLSQKELAAKLGVSQQLISRIEKGRENASLTTLNNIARVLGRALTVDFK
jgi:DNA-binding XRE family transcriptional regulator